MEIKGKGEVISALEDLIPNGKASKPFWARGVDMLGYSLNSLRLSNLEFKDVSLEKTTQMVKLRINPEHTDKLLAVSLLIFPNLETTKMINT